MACVALDSLRATIELEFLQPIPRVPLHDQAPIKCFLKRIFCLQAFLEESSGGATIQNLEIEIREFALKVEDDIEIQISNFLLAKDIECQEKASQELHQTLQEAIENAADLLKITESTSNEDDEDNETQQPMHRLKHAFESENDKSNGSSPCAPKLVGRMVGRHHDHRKIINMLEWGFRDLSLVVIVGMVGVGKTTLAKNVYEDPGVVIHFDIRIWITIPQEYNKDQILRLLLQSISPEAEKKIEKGSAPEELEGQVRSHLCGKRYLIVLDNLHDIWNDIRECFPVEYNGSSILVTTTHLDRYVYNSPSFYIHKMTFLDANESWDLFCNILSFKESMAPDFEKIRSHILEICDGLPLLIVRVAKRLSKCNGILKEWEKVKKEIESLGILDRNALALNYNQLSQDLKVCFLYLGVFPKRKGILVKKLIGLWIVEGFLKSLEHKELENHGYAYLQELIDRSLVLICNWSSDDKVKTCRMHSALHSFCVREAQKEGIFCVVNTLQHSRLPLSEFANSCRWLSLYTHSFDYYVLFSTKNSRSIFFFDDDPETFLPFKLLRVLAFVPSPFLQRVSMHLGNLIFLRYLFISQRFEGLGNIVSICPNLQTLIASSDEPQIRAPTIHLPSKIWELPRLRHLELGDMYTVDPPSEVKRNLHTLSWVVGPTHCRKEVYFSFPCIKKLKIFYKEDLEPSHTHGSSSNPIILDNLDYLRQLERLTISISVSCSVTLPKQSMFSLQLKKLRLSGTKLSQRDLTVISMLPWLRVLKLENALLEREWNVAEGEFCTLRFFLLEDTRLEQLKVDYRSFPSLKRIVLRFCCLQEIPRKFVENYELESTELNWCDSSIVDSAKRILQGRWNFGDYMLKIDGVIYEPPEYTRTNESVEEDLIGTGIGRTELFLLIIIFIYILHKLL